MTERQTAPSAPASGPRHARQPQALPHPESFLLKDLDTGMKSYVTDQEWVEKPTVFPSSADTTGQSKPPRIPLDSRWGDRSSAPQKRTRSDEILSVSKTLRPSDQVRVIANKKRERDFISLYRWQKVHAHDGPVRVLEFSKTGKFLASAGQDTYIRVWDIDTHLSDQRDDIVKSVAVSEKAANAGHGATRIHSAYGYIRKGAPFVTFKGHTSDVIALSWSKNDFLLSGGADRTIRLWHPHAKGFKRTIILDDIVTSVAFHPTDEQICISGTADGNLSMWHLKESKRLSRTETDDFITACAITPDGTTALVGTYNGRCKFYALFDEIQGEWQFKHTTQLDVRSKRAKNAQGKKICGFRFYGRTDNVLVSSNDSRLRLYRLDDKSVLTKFIGHQNTESHLNGSFAPGGRYVLSASENRMIHIWEVDSSLYETFSQGSSSRATDSGASRKDPGYASESFFAQESGQVTAAVFAPRKVPRESLNVRGAFVNNRTSGLVIVTASDEGDIRVFGCC